MARTKSAPLTRSMAMRHLAHLGQGRWVIRASLSWRRKSSSDPQRKRKRRGPFSRRAPDFFLMEFPVPLHRAWADRDDKISCRRITDILDSVFVVRMYESDGAWAKAGARSIDGQLDGSFPNEPHLRMHVVMRRMRHAAGRQRCFMDLQRFSRCELAL